jgi:hypothetical protein
MTASEDGAFSALMPQGSGWGTNHTIFAFQILPPEAPACATGARLGLRRVGLVQLCPQSA